MKTNWKTNVALFMAGQAITLFGSMMVGYAVMWHITLKTQSGLMMTLLAIANTIPIFLISPFGGVWADRFNKKHLINISDGIIAIISLFMAFLFSAGIEWYALLIICLVMRAFGQGVQTPTVSALIPTITPEEKLMKVNGIQGAIMSLVMFASPMAGAAVLAIAPIHALLFIDVITATIGISILAFFVRVPRQEKKDARPSYWTELKEGMIYIKKHKFVRKFMLLAAVFCILIAPAGFLTPLQVVRNWGGELMNIFHFQVIDEHRLAIIEVLFSVGMVLGGGIIAAWGGFKNKSYTLGAAIALNAVGMVTLGLLTNFWLYSVCMGFIGMTVALQNAPIATMLQTNVEPDFMGRVFSVLNMITSVAMPIAMIVFGPLGDIISIEWILIFTGILLFAFSFIAFLDKDLLRAGLKNSD